MELRFNKKLFNNIYWEIDKWYNDTNIRYIWIYGGSSSSKSYSVVQKQIITMLQNENDNALIMRKFSTDIKDSIFADFKSIINHWNISHLFTIQQNFIMCNQTGSFVRFRGLDDSEKLKGISGFKRVILEEVTQFDEEDFKQVKKRVRGSVGQQIIGIFNPISELHWIKVNVFDKDIFNELESNINSVKINNDGDTIILKTNYLDNKYIVGPYFVDKHVIADFEKDKINDFAYYQIYALGEFGTLKTGGEFLKKFDANKHISNIEWNKELPLHLTFDENVNPYLTCMIFQIDGKHIKQIDEICLEDPNNTLADTCNEFKRRYPQNEVKGLFITGDRTSIKQDVKLEKGQNFFTLIQQHLVDYKPRLRIGTSNPSVVVSGGFFNAILGENYNDMKFTVHSNCKRSINDYIHCLEDSDGTIKKTKKTNPLTKVTYEEFGHHIDCVRYLLVNTFPIEYQQYQTGKRQGRITMGKSSMTRHSY